MRLKYTFWIFLPLLWHSVSGYDTWEEYWEAYIQEAYYPRMYPYGINYDDNEFYDNTYGQDAGIKFTIPFAGKYFKGAFISRYGHVELTKNSPSDYTYKELDTSWPNMDYPEEGDPPFISPYIGDWNLRGSSDQGRMFWRRLDPSETEDADEQQIYKNLLEMMSQEVRHHVVGAEWFHALYGLLVTWHEVRFGGCQNDACEMRNTVQMVLLTDGRSSHVIYNFYNVSWVGGIEQSCDPETGRTGEGNWANCVPAQVGFNAGWAQRFTALPDSMSDDIAHIDEKGATSIQGRYIYQTDGAYPVRGGCSNESYADPEEWPMVIHPHSVSLYGGDVVYFSGPCLLPEHNIVCRFENEEVTGSRVEESHSKGMCVAPRMWTAGWKRLCISTDAGENYPYCTNIHIVPKYYMWPKITLHELDRWYAKTTDSDLSLEWDPEALVYPHQRCDDSTWCNHTGGVDLNINIKLIGYAETVSSNGSRTPNWHVLHTFESGMENSGMYSFLPSEHECEVDCDWGHKPPIGLLEISVADDIEQNPRRIYSEPVPLGWFFNWELSMEHGTDWPRTLCMHWSDGEQNYPWSDEIKPCPMTHTQAHRDVGHFMFPPPDCPPGHPCPLQPRPDPHINCADGIVPGPHPSGAASSCCYPPSPHGSLSYGRDHPMGSAAHKASPYANIDSNGHHVVPLLSHMTRDRQPYLWCCNWTNDRDLCIEHYMTVRPTLDAVEYKTPQYAVAYGDPHFATFDGNNYTFNGHGEYWLLKVELESNGGFDSFNLQVRLLQPEPGPHGPIKATMITALVMQEGYADGTTQPKLQIQLAPDHSRARLQVLYNGKEIDLMGPALHYQERYYSPITDMTRKITLRNNDPLDADHQSNVTVMFDTGVAVQAANRDGYMHIVVIAPPVFWGLTKGLFGVWNDDPSDDLRSEHGTVIPADESIEHIHSEFGQTWEISESESRFYYYGSTEWNSFSQPDFRPNYEEPEGPVGNITDDDVTELCGDDFVCRFDYKTTMSQDVANNSAAMHVWVFDAKGDVEAVVACSYFDVPYSEREVDTYMVGGEMTFTRCLDGYTLLGETDYECVRISDTDAEWNPDPDAHCKDDDDIKHEKAMLATAIVVPIILIIIIVVIISAVLFRKKRKSKNSAAAETTSKTKTNEKKSKSKGSKSTNAASVSAERELQFENMAASASRSQSLASMNVSFGSIVLTQDLHTARPPRPTSTSGPPRGYGQPPGHNITAPPQFGGSQTSLGAHGYSLSPQGQAYANRSFDPGNQPAGMPARPPSQPNMLPQQQHNTSNYANTSDVTQPTLANMAAAFQQSQSQQSIQAQQAFQQNQSQQSIQPQQAFQQNQSQQSIPSQQGYPGNQPQQGYPGNQRQGYPGNQPQQGYPGNHRQGYPGTQPKPGYQSNQSGPQGLANIAMADDDIQSDSSFEPRPDEMNRSRASLGGKDTFV